jgi:hypothetical protein
VLSRSLRGFRSRRARFKIAYIVSFIYLLRNRICNWVQVCSARISLLAAYVQSTRPAGRLIIARGMCGDSVLSVISRLPSPHLRVRQATRHVTRRRFAHPRFTSTLLTLPASIVLSLPPYIYLPVFA